MVLKKYLLKSSEMELIAKKATYAALCKYLPPSDPDRERLTLGKVITDKEGIFELYIAAEWPQEPTVISCAKVDRATGEVEVEVFLDLRAGLRASEIK